jgi:hypothetical protein
MRQLLFLLTVSLAMLACKGNESESSGNVSFELSIIDSIRIDYLGMANLMDIHPESKRILLMSSQTREFVLADFNGNILQSFSKSGDMPDSYGIFPLGAGKFDPDGTSFTVISNQGVYTYSLDGKLLIGGKHQENEMPGFAGRASADQEFYWLKNKILTVGAGRGVYPRNTPEFYNAYTSLAWFDTLERKVVSFLPLDENSLFKNGKGHDIAHMIPRMTVSNDQIYVIQGIEPSIKIYASEPPYSLIRKIDFDVPDYFVNEGEEMKSVDPRMINPDVYSGIFENLKATDDYVLTTFFPGIPETQRAPYEGLPWMEMMPAMRKDFPPRMLVLSKDGEVLDDFVLPANLRDKQWLIRDEQLWFFKPTNLDKEEDFLTIYQVKLSQN